MHYKDEGAFTGENSPLQIKTAGANYILIGHSERRVIIMRPMKPLI